LTEAMPFAPGMQVGKYALRHELGAGGYALVFAAHDPILDREVALKLLKPEFSTSEVVVRRFLQEARSTVRIVHPGIVTVFESGEVPAADFEDGDTAYIAMELLEGEALADRLERCGSLAPAAAIEIGRQLAAALEVAHRAGIIHRDLKPGNVFLVEDPLVPGGERAKVFDFGIAKHGFIPPAPGTQTSSMTVLGTPRYMSPEQCRSARTIDHRSDIYALGVMLFELLAGRPLFEGETVEVIAHHLMTPPPSLLEVAPGTPPELAALIEQLLEKEPDARPPSMEAVQHALEAIGEATGLVPAARPSAMPDGLPQPRPATPRPSLDTATTLLSVAAASRSPARRARRSVYAAAALVAIAVSLGAYLALGDPVDARATEPLAQRTVARSQMAAIEPRVPVAGPAAEGEAPVEVARPAEEVVKIVELAEQPAAAREQPEDARGRPAAVRARPAAVRGKPAAPAARSFGFLALASTPPCEIHIDGRAAAARTPLRELKLPAGKHRITLVNGQHAIQDSFAVTIRPGATERVEKDYSKQIERDRRDGTINPFANGGR
jgi:serine/threonine-protein kinase